MPSICHRPLNCHMGARLAFWVLALTLFSSCHKRAGSTTAAPSGPQIFLWKAEHPVHKGARLYLYGTMHVGLESTLDRAVIHALKSVQHLVIEVDPNDGGTKETIQKLMQQHGMLPPGTTLEQVVSKKTWDLVVRASKALGVSPTMFSPMRPWVAAILLGQLHMAQKGLSLSKGKEQLLARHPSRRGKKTLTLEKAVEQLSIFYTLSTKLQETLLLDAANDIQKDRRSPKPGQLTIESAYASGSLGAVRKVLLRGYDAYPEFLPLRKKLFDDRNLRMAEGIHKLTGPKSSLFVAVGVGHFPGRKGILALLKKRGYKLTRVTPLGLEKPAQPRLKGSTGRAEATPWFAISDTASGVVAQFPFAAQRTVQSMATGSGNIINTTYEAVELLFQARVVISRLPPPFEAIIKNQAIRQKMLDQSLKAWVSSASGALITSKRIPYMNGEARYALIKTPSGVHEGYLYLEGVRLYHIYVVRVGKSVPGDKRPGWTRRFFTSVKITPLTKKNSAK